MGTEHLDDKLLQIRPVVLGLPVGHLQLHFLIVAHGVIPPYTHRGRVQVHMLHIHICGAKPVLHAKQPETAVPALHCRWRSAYDPPWCH